MTVVVVGSIATSPPSEYLTISKHIPVTGGDPQGQRLEEFNCIFLRNYSLAETN